jgi:hypothetical protein
MGAYSFINVSANITGPGGNIAIGSSAGAAKEGISTAFDEDKVGTITGADGSIMHSLHAGMTGTVHVRLLKTSPANAALNQMFNFQRATAGNTGQNTIVVTDVVRGDVVTGRAMAFIKHPDNSWAEEGNTVEWTFRGIVNETLGLGQADLTLP